MSDVWLPLVLKSSLILGIALVVRALVSRATASLRHLVVLTGLFGALVFPIASLLFPSFRINAPIPQPLIAGRAQIQGTSTAVVSRSDSYTTRSVDGQDVALSPTPSIQTITRIGRRDFDHSQDAAINYQAILVGLWLAGFVAALLYQLAGWKLANRLARRATKFTTDIEDLAIPSGTELLLNSDSTPGTPLTWGIRQPIILLPLDSENWTDEAIRTVVRHEVAHILRRDSFSQGVANLVCSVFWFNPLFWFAFGVLRSDEEHAADDFVIESGLPPTTYAELLVDLAANASRHPYPLHGFAAPTKLEKRVTAILDSARPRSRRVGTVGMTLVGGIGAIAVGIGPLFVGTNSFDEVHPGSDKWERITQPVASAERVQSNFWRLELDYKGAKSAIYVLQKGPVLHGWDVQMGPNSNTQGDLQAPTTTLDSWTYQSPITVLNDGSKLTPLRVIESAYRKLLAQSGILVTPTTIASLKSEVQLLLPPDADVEYAEFVKRQGANASNLTGPAVWFRGNVLGIIDRQTIAEAKGRNLHWPQAMKPTVTRPPTGYWEVIFPTEGFLAMNAYQFDRQILTEVRTRGSEERRPIRVGNLVTGDKITDWGFESRTIRIKGRYDEAFGETTIYPKRLDDDRYRADLESHGVVVFPLTREEFESFANVKFTPSLALGLAAAKRDDTARRLAQIRAQTNQVPGAPGARPHSQGTIVMNGETIAGSVQEPLANSHRPIFDEARAKTIVADENRQLNVLAQDYASAKVAEATSVGNAGQAAKRLVAIQQQMQPIERSYGLIDLSSTANPTGSEAFFKSLQKDVEAKSADLRSKLNTISALYSKGQVSLFELERAKELVAIEKEKAHCLNRRPPPGVFVDQSPTQKRVIQFELTSMSFQANNEDLRKVLEQIFKEGGMTLILDPAVHGQVTLDAKNVLRSALLDKLYQRFHLKESVFNGEFTVAPAK